MDGRVFLKTALALLTFLAFTNVAASGKTTLKNIKSTDMDTLELTQEWDKTFPQSDRVEHSKITFHNRYGITLAADVYKPKNARGRLAAVAVSGPYGAVKEQVSGRYAQTLAERGFLTVAFDPSFYGESGGAPRYLTSPEISTVLMIHGAEAHSRYFSEDAYKRLTGDNKELLIIPGANHVDLYDNLDVIPFDKIDVFFKEALKGK